MKQLTASPTEIAAAFTEWDRRFREDPDKFQSEASRLRKGTPATYAQACSRYFCKLLSDDIQRKAKQGGLRARHETLTHTRPIR